MKAPSYYIKKSFEIYRKNGLGEVIKQTSAFLTRILIRQQLKITGPKDIDTNLPKLIYTPPQKIKFLSSLSRYDIPVTDANLKKTTVENRLVGVWGGDWDRCKKEWDQLLLYSSFVERYEHGIDWEETDFYQLEKSRIEEGNPTDSGVSSIKQLKRRCSDLDKLYESMENNGYVSQLELMENPEKEVISKTSTYTNEINGEKFPDECMVGIGRNGELIRFQNGRHRVSMAKILGMEKMPVLLVARHEKWEKIRNYIHENGLPEELEDLQDHPDLQDVIDA